MELPDLKIAERLARTVTGYGQFREHGDLPVREEDQITGFLRLKGLFPILRPRGDERDLGGLEDLLRQSPGLVGEVFCLPGDLFRENLDHPLGPCAQLGGIQIIGEVMTGRTLP